MNAPGKMVKVNDTYMHVFSISPSTTAMHHPIVFLSGSGTECPTYDFKPLWHLLKDRFHIVVVERSGYGWSGQTSHPRDIDTILAETREALKQADIAGPFIPAPHSLSGLEAIYWAQKYPDEVYAILGLDMAVPQVYRIMEIPKYFPLLARFGHLLRRPLAAAMVKNHPAVKNNLLDKTEREAMEVITSRQLLSKNMMDEIDYVKENAVKVENGKSPQVPLLCFLSNDKANLKAVPAWGRIHREYFSANDNAHFIDLTCGHYVHREAPDIIAESIIQFL